jgi:hypothetical protein
MELEKPVEFLVDHIEPSGLVVGRNGSADVPVGTLFVSIVKTCLDGERPNLSSVELGTVASIGLRLTEVHWYHRMIDVIPGGHTAGLRLEGSGLEALGNALAQKREREFISIRA